MGALNYVAATCIWLHLIDGTHQSFQVPGLLVLLVLVVSPLALLRVAVLLPPFLPVAAAVGGCCAVDAITTILLLCLQRLILKRTKLLSISRARENLAFKERLSLTVVIPSSSLWDFLCKQLSYCLLWALVCLQALPPLDLLVHDLVIALRLVLILVLKLLLVF